MTMPERVRRYGLQPAEMDPDPREGDWVRYDDYSVLESRLREVEAERDELRKMHRDEMDLHDEMEKRLAAERDALQTDLAALTPLARWGCGFKMANAAPEHRQPSNAEFAAARAILARGEGA